MNIVTAFEDSKLIGAYIKEKDNSFYNWKVFLKSVYGLPMDKREKAVFQKFTGRKKPPKKPAESIYCLSGRKSGKTLLASCMAIYTTLLEDFWHSHVRPGQKVYFPIIAVDKYQARECFDYCDGILHSNPIFKKQVQKSLTWEIELKNSCVIMIRTASFRQVRGPLYCGSVIDEAAFLRDETSRNPADELIKGILPGLLPGGKCLVISSVYGRFGVCYDAYRSYWAQDDDETLIWVSDTKSMHPDFPQKKIDKALKTDRVHALAEYYSQFRDDISNFLPAQIVEDSVVPGRYELPPISEVRYYAYCDMSSGRQDSACLCLAHREESGKIVIDLIRERIPPFSPKSVISEFSKILTTWEIREVYSDRYAPGFVSEGFRDNDIEVVASKLSSSEIYENFIGYISSGEVELLDNNRLKSQLIGLERKTRPGGHDLICHYPGAHDDIAVAVCGAATLAAQDEGGGPKEILWV